MEAVGDPDRLQTSGGVLFTGDLNNDFLALDAKTGDVLYRFKTSGSIGGGVISYSLESNMPRRPPARFPPSSVVQARRRSSSSPFPNPPSKSVRRNAYCRLTAGSWVRLMRPRPEGHWPMTISVAPENVCFQGKGVRFWMSGSENRGRAPQTGIR